MISQIEIARKSADTYPRCIVLCKLTTDSDVYHGRRRRGLLLKHHHESVALDHAGSSCAARPYHCDESSRR